MVIKQVVAQFDANREQMNKMFLSGLGTLRRMRRSHRDSSDHAAQIGNAQEQEPFIRRAKKGTQDAFKSFLKQWPKRTTSRSGSSTYDPRRDISGQNVWESKKQGKSETLRIAPTATTELSSLTPPTTSSHNGPITTDTTTSWSSTLGRRPNRSYGIDKAKLGVVFLQHKGETKRAVLSEDVLSWPGIRALFLRTFIDISTEYVTSVKIYIQDPAKEVFYELEDIKDVRDRSVLRLHDRDHPLRSNPLSKLNTISAGTQSLLPSPQSPQESDDNYFSEPELNPDTFDRRRKGNEMSSIFGSYSQRRYGSEQEYRTSNRSLDRAVPAPPKPTRFGSQPPFTSPTPPPAPPTRTVFPPSSKPPLDLHSSASLPPIDLYSRSDSRNGSLPRSGSITPVIDEEARIRMDYMESQLSNLSNLVHNALMSHPGGSGPVKVHESLHRDLETIRRELFGDDVASESGSISRYSDMGSEKGSFANSDRDMACSDSGSVTTAELRNTLRQSKHRVKELQSELRQLRRVAQVNAQTTRTILRDTFDRVKFILNTNKTLQLYGTQGLENGLPVSDDPIHLERNMINQEQDRLRSSTSNLERNIGQLEKDIEGLRQNVVNGHRRLRVTEVEKFTEKLTDLGKTAAVMKTQFPNFQNRLKNVMSAEMEKVVREERFLKEEPERLDNILRRCKKLTNTMVTMKKLAMVQDPNTPPSSVADNLLIDNQYEFAVAYPASSTAQMNSLPMFPSDSKPSLTNANSLPVQHEFSSRDTRNYHRSSNSEMRRKVSDTSVLDSILEELRNVATPTPPSGFIKPQAVKFGTNTVIQQSNGDNRENKPNDPLGNYTSGGSSDSGIEITDGNRPRQQPPPPPPPPPDNYASVDLAGDNTLLSRIQKARGDLKPPQSAVIKSPQRPVLAASSRSLARGPSPQQNMSGKTYAYRSSSMRSQSESPSFQQNLIPPVQRSSGSVSPVPYSMPPMSPSSRSTTPNSITSEPATYYRRGAPPPPPRSSSRGPTEIKYSQAEINHMKEQLMADFYQKHHPSLQMGMGRDANHTPTPSIMTNAVDEDIRYLKSASSSESVNSQDGFVPARPPLPMRGNM